MSAWTREGGRSMTLYAAAYAEALWLVLALLTLAVAAVAGWCRARSSYDFAQVLVGALMVGWMGHLVLMVLG